MLWPGKYLVLIALLAYVTGVSAQVAVKEVSAHRTDSAIVIDGTLDEAAWKTAAPAGAFIQYAQYPGQPSTQSTEVKILYDDEAIYIGARMYDTRPDSILRQLTGRDEFDGSNTDAFGVTFDTYFDKQNGFGFVVTAAGVQADGKLSSAGTDYSWNAAWFSKVQHDALGWCAEMKIPYSAIRFPGNEAQKWGLNFMRVIRRIREKSYWSPVMPDNPNFLLQEGELTGIRNIRAPLRLALLPYLSVYGQNYDGNNNGTINGGMDIKYGITESFTLDMTLVPDFGQTLYDDRVLNLSPVEVRYNERRYFFTEGVDLFNKNDLFYSRRVGGVPVNFSALSNMLKPNEVVTENPVTTRLYNAIKVSGRNAGKLGVGFFNAVAAPTYATVRDTLEGTNRKVETSPLTNYNVVVLDQVLKYNSFVSFVNTNVSRQQNSYNANVSAFLFRLINKQGNYSVTGSADYSYLYSGGNKLSDGFRYFAQAGKIKGNYTWYVNTKVVNDKFNPNDLGYLDRNNRSFYTFSQNYNTYKPFWKVVNTYNHVGVVYYRVFNPDVFQSLEVYGSHNATFTNFLTVGAYWDFLPTNTYDYYEPRTLGRYYTVPQSYMAGGFFSTDYRKKFALDFESNNRWFVPLAQNVWYWELTPRYRVSDKLSFVYGLNHTSLRANSGFVGRTGDSIVFGTRNIKTWENSLTASYVFNNVMSLYLSARHYWSQVDYSSYSALNNDGSLSRTAWSGNSNLNFNSFNIYTGFTWQFKPGSEMSVVYQNSIFSRGSQLVADYSTNLNRVLAAPQSNSLSVKVVYYLDYLVLRKRFSR